MDLINQRTEDDDLPYIGLEHVEPWTGRLIDQPGDDQPAGSTSRFAAGDVLFGKLRPYLAKVVCAPHAGRCSPEFLVLRPRLHESRYLHYSLLADDFIQSVDALTYGSKMPRASWEDVGGVVVPVPPPMEQRAIADFLDEKTSAIDTLAERKQALIDRVQEQRQATIAKAVTRGLNPNAPVKDSGCAWLGFIPEHWNLLPLKHALRKIEQGWSPSCENWPAGDDEWGVMKVGCVNGAEFDPMENKALPADTRPIPEYEIRAGDVLMSRANTRALLGSAVLVRNVRPRLILCDKLYRLRPNAALLDAEFLVYAISSRAARDQLEQGATGASSSMQNISQDTVRNLMVALPPLCEQEEIRHALRERTSVMESSIEKLRRSIEALSHYRRALISAAVTGQIDVRDHASRADFLPQELTA